MTRRISAADPPPGWPFDANNTDAELSERRARVIRDLTGPGVFTCDGCKDRHRCALAFDPYNPAETEDRLDWCLAEK